MESTCVSDPPDLAAKTADLFNAAIAAASVSAAFETGLLDRLHRDRQLSITSYCREADLHEPSVVAILRALEAAEIVTLDSERQVASQGTLFSQAFADKGYFLWLTSGYGHLWQHLGALVRNGARPLDADDRSFVQRDGRAIAAAGRDYGARFVDRHFDALVDAVPFATAADLGCGSAARLIDLVRRHPGVRGLGLDFNPDAVRLARAAVEQAGLADRIDVTCADVRSLQLHAFESIDLLFSFFMAHDLWPRPRCVRILSDLRRSFPSIQRFLLCDTCRAPRRTPLPIFSLGFELTHAVMGQYIPSEDEWLDLFDEAGWRCAGRHPIDIPFSTIFDLRPGR